MLVIYNVRSDVTVVPFTLGKYKRVKELHMSGRACSSVEAAVMAAERKGSVIKIARQTDYSGIPNDSRTSVSAFFHEIFTQSKYFCWISISELFFMCNCHKRQFAKA